MKVLILQTFGMIITMPARKMCIRDSCQPDQVAEGPGYGVAVSLDKTVFTVRGSHDGGDLTLSLIHI